jgi:hypothetical protein
MLRDALKAMGRADLIGNGKHHLIPSFQPKGTVPDAPVGKGQTFKTKYTGLDAPASKRGKTFAGNRNKAR